MSEGHGDHEEHGGGHEDAHGGHAEAKQCIFCSIIQNKIPAKKILENEDAIAFLDINPRSKGHTVVVPKKHAVKLTDMPEEKVGPFFETVQATAAKLVAALDAEGYNIGMNNGEAAGQAVAHAHAHIIPRYKADQHHAGFEAAFPVNEEAKHGLDETFREIESSEGGHGDGHGGGHHEAKGHDAHDKKEAAPQKKEKWKFLGEDFNHD